MASRAKDSDLLETEITASNPLDQQCLMSLPKILICGETISDFFSEHINVEDFLVHFGQKQVEEGIVEGNEDSEETVERNGSPEIESSLLCVNKEHSDNISSKSNFVVQHNEETRVESDEEGMSGFDDDDDDDDD